MMKKFLTQPIEIPIEQYDQFDAKEKIAEFCALPLKDIHSVSLYKRSIDARRKNQVKFVCSFVFETDKQPQNAQPHIQPKNVLESVQKCTAKQSIVVVGSGPAGLFASRVLTEAGHTVTIVERGEDIDERKKTVENFNANGVFDCNSNIQFGLGGAGTFSDGKLTTGISSPYTFTVFQEFVANGAPLDILTNALPHIGTDNLVNVVANMRTKIEQKGGKFLFNTMLTDLEIENQKLVGIVLKDLKTAKTFQMPCDKVILAVGHSARETFKILLERSVNIVAKPFAVGVRVEHKRQFVSQAQFGSLGLTHRDLQSASYKMTANFADGRSCYTFCMCPGGVVVAANSTQNSIVTNGMSNFMRDGDNSNSALVVNVSMSDFGTQPLCGIEFQSKLEREAYNATTDYKAPCQNVVDFLQKKKTEKFDLIASYPRGVQSVNLWEVLPAFICQAIADGLIEFGKKLKGFDKCGVLTAVESRTSSPVKILRNDNFESNIQGLYPCGEGAGYAGGIVSAAVDGLKVALSICKQ